MKAPFVCGFVYYIKWESRSAEDTCASNGVAVCRGPPTPPSHNTSAGD